MIQFVYQINKLITKKERLPTEDTTWMDIHDHFEVEEGTNRSSKKNFKKVNGRIFNKLFIPDI